MNLLCAGAEENRIKFSQLCFTFTWLYLSYMKLNGIHIIFIFMTRIGDAYWFSLSPAIPFQISLYRWMFPFPFFSVRTFVRSLVYPSSAYITYYNFLFVLPEFCLWVRACVRVFIYICLCARNHAHFFVLFCYFFFIRIRLTLPPSLSHTLTPCSGSERLFHFYPYCYICMYMIIYRIILARLHTCINKRIPNIHVNGFGYALLMSVFACISFSLSLEVAKKKLQQSGSAKWIDYFFRSVRARQHSVLHCS